MELIPAKERMPVAQRSPLKQKRKCTCLLTCCSFMVFCFSGSSGDAEHDESVALSFWHGMQHHHNEKNQPPSQMVATVVFLTMTALLMKCQGEQRTRARR
jgi:hypothetical protein